MTEQLFQNFAPEDPLGIIAEQNKGRNLDQATLDWFRSRDVSPLHLVKTWVGYYDLVLFDDVVFLPRNTFEFDRYKKDYPAEPALTFVCWDALGDARDICAWLPKTGKIATWRGCAALCGEDNLYAPRLEGVLQVHADVLSWFRANRSGVVVLDRQRAAPMLRDTGTLLASSPDHGRKLQDMLRVPPPRILVPKPTVAA
jgi:hypothetical protein